MKKSFYASVIAFFGICMIHSQDSTNTDDKDRDNPLLKYDWGQIGITPYITATKASKNNVDPYLSLARTIDTSASIVSLNYPLSDSSISKMPVYEPKGIHKMRIFEIDSTEQFYLKIYTVP